MMDTVEEQARKGAADIPDPIDTATPGFLVDVSKWKMGDYMDWTACGREGDMEAMNVIAATVICEWPFGYAGRPSSPENYRQLDPIDWKDAIAAVENAVMARFRTSKTTSVPSRKVRGRR